MNDPASKMIAALFAEQRILTVGELTGQIKDRLDGEFFALHVQGEISNYKRHPSGHWYFTLKDSDAQLRGVFFRQWNRLMRFEPENGLEVRLRGRLTVYEPRGEYQIVVETMEPVGVGALQLAFEQQVRKLAQEGLFDESRKRPLPTLPQRIGIVTSPVGAAIRDMLQVLERRNRGVDVIITPVRVQGTGAAREIADAIRLLNQYSKKSSEKVDVIIVGRGGGSVEDLWAFNEEQVARAVYESEIPVVSAVGHETDFTITDFVADSRASTPSAAAEIVVREAAELSARVEELWLSLQRGIVRSILQKRSALHDLIESQSFAQTSNTVLRLAGRCRELEVKLAASLKENLRRSESRLREARRRLLSADLRAPLALQSVHIENLDQRLYRSMQKVLDLRRHHLAVAATALNALSPLSVLGRGYVLAKDKAGHVISHASDLALDQFIRLRFEDGEVGCQVTDPKR